MTKLLIGVQLLTKQEERNRLKDEQNRQNLSKSSHTNKQIDETDRQKIQFKSTI